MKTILKTVRWVAFLSLGLLVLFALVVVGFSVGSNWFTKNWLYLLVALVSGVILWNMLVGKGDHHHGHGGGGIGSLKGWLIPLGVAFAGVCLGIKWMVGSDNETRRVDLAIERYAREATNGAPPTTEWVQMGSWTNVLAPGQFADVEFFLNSTTSFKQSGAVLLQRGRGRGDRFVSDGSPIVLVRPEDRARFSAGQTARLYGPHGGTNNVVVVVTRQP